jgi:hypothetical protein
LGGNFGGKNLRGKFWGKFWGKILGGGNFGGKFFFFFFFLGGGGGGDLEGKDHYASYNNVIGRVSICIILCS